MPVSDSIAESRAYIAQYVNTSTRLFEAGASAMGAIGYTNPTWTPVPHANSSELPSISDLLAEPPQLTQRKLPTLGLAPNNPQLADIPALNISAPPALRLPTAINLTKNAPQYTPINPIRADTAPIMDEVPPIELTEPDEFTVEPPDLTMPNRPAEIGAFSKSAPAIRTDFALPPVPSALANLPVPPKLVERTLPAAPQVSLPEFVADKPLEGALPPTNFDGIGSAAYDKAFESINTNLGSAVEEFIKNIDPQHSQGLGYGEARDWAKRSVVLGGTGVNPDIEIGIYERSRALALAEANKVRDGVLADMGARGFTMPSGALTAALQAARQASADANAKAANEVAISQVELEHKTVQFAVTTAIALQNTVTQLGLTYQSQMIQASAQAHDYAKMMIDASVAVYNAAVESFKVALEAYKTEAQVYQSRLQAALSAYDLYKAQVDAYQATLGADKMLLDTYRNELDAISTLATIYRTQVDAIVQTASLEKLKIDLFGAEVQAYTAQVSAKEAEYHGYSSAIQGETAKAGLFAERVRAYGAGIDVFKTVADTKLTTLKAQLAVNDSRLQAYKAGLDVQVETNRAIAQINSSQSEVYTSTIAAQEAAMRGDVTHMTATAELWKSDVTARLAEVQAASQSNMAKLEQAKLEYLAYTTKTEFAKDLVRTELQFDAAALEQWKTKVGARVEAARFAATKMETVYRVNLENSKGQLTSHIEDTRARAEWRMHVLQPMLAQASAVGNIAGSVAAGMTSLVAETMTSAG